MVSCSCQMDLIICIQGHRANKSYGNDAHPATLIPSSSVPDFAGRGPKTYIAGNPRVKNRSGASSTLRAC